MFHIQAQNKKRWSSDHLNFSISEVSTIVEISDRHFLFQFQLVRLIPIAWIFRIYPLQM